LLVSDTFRVAASNAESTTLSTGATTSNDTENDAALVRMVSNTSPRIVTASTLSSSPFTARAFADATQALRAVSLGSCIAVRLRRPEINNARVWRLADSAPSVYLQDAPNQPVLQRHCAV